MAGVRPRTSALSTCPVRRRVAASPTSSGSDTRDRRERRRLAGLADVQVARHREEDERLLFAEAPLVDERPRRLLARQLERLAHVAARRRVRDPRALRARSPATSPASPSGGRSGRPPRRRSRRPCRRSRRRPSPRACRRPRTSRPAAAPGSRSRAAAVQVVVEVAAVPAGPAVRDLLAVCCDADDADHRPSPGTRCARSSAPCRPRPRRRTSRATRRRRSAGRTRG